MTNPTLRQFAESQSFESRGFPQGDTFLDLDVAIVEKIEVDFNGKKETKFQITQGEKVYIAPAVVFKDIKVAIAGGFKRVRVTRTGQGKEQTRYTTVGANA
jgi:hypothetical protein